MYLNAMSIIIILLHWDPFFVWLSDCHISGGSMLAG
jgi:hypothetical protein